MNARTINALSAMAILGATPRFAEASNKQRAANDTLPQFRATQNYWNASVGRQALQ